MLLDLYFWGLTAWFKQYFQNNSFMNNDEKINVLQPPNSSIFIIIYLL